MKPSEIINTYQTLRSKIFDEAKVIEEISQDFLPKLRSGTWKLDDIDNGSLSFRQYCHGRGIDHYTRLVPKDFDSFIEHPLREHLKEVTDYEVVR